MANKLRVAVILAAGMGERLETLGKTIPKGFLRLGKRPIIEESIDNLLDAGIRQIIIVTGHHFEYYERLKESYSGIIKTIHNSLYARSGSMYSLYCAKDWLMEDFLLLESDIVYEARAVSRLLQFPTDNAVLLSGPTYSGDEVYVATKGIRIVGMSKDPNKFNAYIAGELVGITKVSQLLFKEMIVEAEIQFNRTLQVAYETDCLSAVSARFPLYHCLVSDLIWSEIDTPSDMRHTQDTVYPAIINQAQVSGNIESSPLGQQPIDSNSGYTYEPGNGNNV
ncbi:MAG: phosphocholine cytidylyltransferase family protein [Gammaproteobacteria bacterium]|nr:phosphocholine cytidylyltransferase family protein [Gammaproteobacteria bacterium]